MALTSEEEEEEEEEEGGDASMGVADDDDDGGRTGDVRESNSMRCLPELSEEDDEDAEAACAEVEAEVEAEAAGDAEDGCAAWRTRRALLGSAEDKGGSPFAPSVGRRPLRLLFLTEASDDDGAATDADAGPAASALVDGCRALDACVAAPTGGESR